MTWLLLAFLAAICTSLTTIFAKIGIRKVNSNFATMYRTGIVILCSIVVCLISDSFKEVKNLTLNNYLFLGISGIMTGLSWLCYYRAIKLGDVNKVAPIDKSSFILTSILLLIFFFGETTNNGNPLTIVMLFVSMSLMFFGTLLMISKQETDGVVDKKWLIYAILSTVFAALVNLFVKIGLKGTSHDLGTLFRAIIVFIFAIAIVIVRKDYKGASSIDKKSYLFLTLSGIATGGAWLFENAAISNGVAVVVNSIGKLSILLTMLLSFLILKEKFTKKSLLGLTLLTLGIIVIVVFSL